MFQTDIPRVPIFSSAGWPRELCAQFFWSSLPWKSPGPTPQNRPFASRVGAHTHTLEGVQGSAPFRKIGTARVRKKQRKERERERQRERAVTHKS